MKFFEYGKKENPAVLLIHGMGCSAINSFGMAKELLEDRYRIIIVALDGHDGENGDFSSIIEQAEKITSFIERSYNGRLNAVLGMSLGGFITLELICKHNIYVEKVIIESGYMNNLPFPKIIAGLAAWGFRSVVEDKNRIITRLGMRLIMGYCFSGEKLYFEASPKTIYNCEFSCLTYKLPDNLEKLKAVRLQYLYGAKEKFMINGMKTLKKYIPNLIEICMGSVGHGEIMFTNPKEYACLVEKTLLTQ